MNSVQQDGIVTNIQNAFADPQMVAKYTEGPPCFVPGYNSMLSMAAIFWPSVRVTMREYSFSAPAAAWS